MAQRIQAIQRTVYFAPAKRRHYFSAPAAAKAEASARMLLRFPTERSEFENGMMTVRGGHFSEDERLAAMCKRLAKRILRNLRSRA